MMNFKGFNIEHKNDKLIISDGKYTLTLAPAEVGTLTSLIIHAGGLLDFPGLPEFIKSDPFVIHFSPKGECMISRIDADGRLLFGRSTQDDVIQALDQILKNFTDSKRLKRRGKGRPHGFSYPDPIV